MTEVASLQAVFTGNTTGFDAAAAAVESRLTGMVSSVGTKLTNIGGSMQRLGGQLTLVFAPVGLALGGALSASIKFEDAFAGVLKTVDASPAQFDALRDSIRDMATSPDHFTSSMKNANIQLARIMELGGQMGIPQQHLAKFTETVGMLSMSTDLTADSAAMMIGQFANVTQMPVGDVDRFGAAVVDLGNNFATTESQIMEMAQRISGAGQVVGMLPQDILAVATALSSAGINAEAGGSAISRVLLEINTAVGQGGPKLDLFAKTAGMTREEFGQAWSENPASTLNQFVLGLGAANTAGDDVVGTLEALGLSDIRVRDALLRLATGSDVLTSALEVSNTAWDENTALVEEAGKRAETTQSGINRVRNQANDLGVTLGDIVKPRLDDFLFSLGPIIEGIGEWAEANPDLTAGILAVAAGLALLGPAMFVVGTIFSGVGTIITGVGVAFGLLLSPITLAVAGGIAAGYLFYTYVDKYFGGVKPFLDALAHNFGVAFGIIRGWIEDGINAITGFVSAVGEAVQDFGELLGLIDDNRGLSGDPSQLSEIVAQHEAGITGSGAIGGRSGQSVVPAPGGGMTAGGSAGGPRYEMNFNIGTIVASDYGGGVEAARGFEAEIRELWRRGA